MIRRLHALSLAVLLAGVAAPALAQAPAAYEPAASPSRFAVGGSIGTDGLSISGSYLATDRLVLRGQGSFLNIDNDFSTSSVDYKGKFTSNVGGGFLDLHPVANPFFVEAGLDFGERKVDVTASPTVNATIKINGVTYTASQVGSVVGSVQFSDVSPVVGLGWDNSLHGARRFGFRVMAGVLVSDDPSVRLTAIGPFATDPTVLTNLRAEEQRLRDDASDFRVYPVVQAGLSYRF